MPNPISEVCCGLCDVMARNMTGSNMIPLGSTLKPGGSSAGLSLLLPSYLTTTTIKQEGKFRLY